jgi:hypothetical protein
VSTLSRTGAGALVINPTNNDLGNVRNRLIVTDSAANPLTQNTNNMAPAYIISDNDKKSGEFVYYDATVDATGYAKGYVEVTTALPNVVTDYAGVTANDGTEIVFANTKNQTVNTALAIYALRMPSIGNAVSTTSGTGSLTIGDGTNPAGVIMGAGMQSRQDIQIPVTFASGSEAVIYTSGDDRGTWLKFSGGVTADSGLTVAGFPYTDPDEYVPVQLDGTNNISGPVTINAGDLELLAGGNGFGNVVPVHVGALGVLDLDVDLTVSNLSGDGFVDTGDNTLTVLGGVIPGTSPGTLTVDGDDGQLIIGQMYTGGPAPAGLNRSIFELGALAGPNDLLLVGDIPLIIEPGSIMEIVDLGGMEVGQYTLVQYADGLTGQFGGLFLPPDVQAQLDYQTPGQVILNVTGVGAPPTVIPEPATMLLVVAGAGAIGGYVRRRRRS